MAEIAETVYGTNEEGHVMSEKVSVLATNVYKEFERMIKKYDEDVVKELTYEGRQNDPAFQEFFSFLESMPSRFVSDKMAE